MCVLRGRCIFVLFIYSNHVFLELIVVRSSAMARPKRGVPHWSSFLKVRFVFLYINLS